MPASASVDEPVDPRPAADPRARALLLYDASCPLCQWSVRVLRKLDWLGRVQYQDARDVDRLPATDPPLVPERLLEEMHLLTPDRAHIYHGFGAFRWMAWRMPLLWPVAPLLCVPGVPAIGQRIYLWVARNRFSLVPCKNGACELPARGTKSSW